MAKKLLNEAVVRRFQSLANIKPINEMSYKEEKEEEKMEETIEENTDENLEEGYMEADEDPADAEAPEAPEMDMGAEEEMGMEAEGGVMELTPEEAELLIKLGDMAKAELENMDGEEEMEDAPEMPEMGAEEEEEAPEMP